jgi:hypothetical protein
MTTKNHRSRVLQRFRWWRRGQSPDEEEPVVNEPLLWHDYTQDVCTAKKQTLKLTEPIGNLTFHVHFRRLRCAKQRAQHAEEETVDAVPTTTQTRQSLAPSEAVAFFNAAASVPADSMPNRTRFATDPAGNIRRLDAPRAKQDYFSISRSITWQGKIKNRLQVWLALWLLQMILEECSRHGNLYAMNRFALKVHEAKMNLHDSTSSEKSEEVLNQSSGYDAGFASRCYYSSKVYTSITAHVLAEVLLELPIGILLMCKGASFLQLLQMIPLPKIMRTEEGSALPNMRVS